MKVDRRRFLGESGGVTALMLGLNAFAPAILRQKLIAAPPATGKKKLVYIFLRGGMDAVNAAVPRGDPNYSVRTRPTLFLKPGETLPLEGSFIELHPALEPMMEIFRAGDLAILHRVGYRGHNRSHFESQQFFENGTTDQPKLQEGILFRQALEKLDLLRNQFVAFGLSDRQLVSLKGRYAIANARDIRSFRLGGAGGQERKFLGSRGGEGEPGRGFLGVYGRAPRPCPRPYESELYHTGATMAEVMRRLSGIDPAAYKPENGAEYPDGGFFSQVRQAAQLLKETPVQLVGMDLGGFDTHGNQGKLDGAYPGLLRRLATAYQALYRDLRGQWDDVLVVTVTEFGRTSKENGSKGTDHGEAIVMFVAGGSVRGGVYNAPDLDAWNAGGGIFSSESKRYLAHWTDYRAVFAEIFSKHFGDDLPTVNKVIPNYDALALERERDFRELGFLS